MLRQLSKKFQGEYLTIIFAVGECDDVSKCIPVDKVCGGTSTGMAKPIGKGNWLMM
jgi:hypothetical protein